MRRGEAGILIACGISVLVLIGWRAYQMYKNPEPDRGIPFYSTATPELKAIASRLVPRYGCHSCHNLWGIRDMTANVPSPSLDGIGSLKTEQWFYDYLSAPDPQMVLPSRLKKEYRMPSYATIPEPDRRALAQYLSSLKVQDWYLEETKRAEYEKLTGRNYPGASSDRPTQ